jgi:hypothetical protein
MLLNNKQAAQLLKTTRSAIANAIRSGLLTDHKERDAKKKKHYSLTLDKDVRALAKTHIYTGRKWIAKTPGMPKQFDIVTKAIDLPSPVGSLSRIESKLDKLQESLDTLLKIWS